MAANTSPRRSAGLWACCVCLLLLAAATDARRADTPLAKATTHGIDASQLQKSVAALLEEEPGQHYPYTNPNAHPQKDLKFIKAHYRPFDEHGGNGKIQEEDKLTQLCNRERHSIEKSPLYPIDQQTGMFKESVVKQFIASRLKFTNTVCDICERDSIASSDNYTREDPTSPKSLCEETVGAMKRVLSDKIEKECNTGEVIKTSAFETMSRIFKEIEAITRTGRKNTACDYCNDIVACKRTPKKVNLCKQFDESKDYSQNKEKLESTYPDVGKCCAVAEDSEGEERMWETDPNGICSNFWVPIETEKVPEEVPKKGFMQGVFALFGGK